MSTEEIAAKLKEHEILIIPYSFWATGGNERNVTVYDNDIARESSIEEAVIIRRFIYLWEKLKADRNEVFIVPKDFCQPVGLSIYAFRRVMETWEKKKIITTTCRGIPLKKFYTLNENRLALHLSYLKRIKCDPHLAENGKIGCLKQELNLAESGNLYNRIRIGENNNSGGEPRLGFGVVEKSFEKTAASRLETLLRRHRRVTGPVQIKTWQRIIRGMLKANSKETIKAVIQFLENDDNFKWQYTPVFYSATGFKTKFDGLRAAMDRTAAAKPFDNQQQASEEEQWVLDLLNSLDWPKGSQSDLLECVRDSLIAYTAFSVRFWAMPKAFKARSSISYFHEHLGAFVYTSPKQYVLDWFRAVHYKLSRWKDWNDKLQKYKWTVTHPDHVTMLEEHSTRFSANAGMAKQILELTK